MPVADLDASPDRFVEAPAYAEWLTSPTAPLETLERERARRTRKKE